MGMEPLFCCFKDQRPNMLAFTGLGASGLAFAILIWGLADLDFKRDGVAAIYIIAFVLLILCLLAFIALLIFINVRDASRTINNLGRIFCLVILCMCGVAFIFLLIAFIILIVDYSKLNSALKDIRNGKYVNYDGEWAINSIDLKTFKIKGHKWGAVFVPSIFGLIALVIMAFVANVLYKFFTDRMNSTPNVVPVNSTQNTITTVPNYPQPGIFPNNNGPVPPMVNNVAYPVINQQSGVNLNNKIY